MLLLLRLLKHMLSLIDEYRICPGRYFADAALFINIASVLHVFNITPPLDDDGIAIRVNVEMSDGFISYVRYLPL